MQFHCASCQGVERVNENKKECKMVRCPWVLDIVSIVNGHVPFCGGQVVFELAHTSWWVNKFMCH
jgi:hypothetical protein